MYIYGSPLPLSSSLLREKRREHQWNDRFLLSERREENGVAFPFFSGIKARREGVALPSLPFPSKGILCKVSQTIPYTQYIYIYITHIIYGYILCLIFESACEVII